MGQRIAEFLRTFISENAQKYITPILESAIVTALVGAIFATFRHMSLEWRMVLAVSLFGLSYPLLYWFSNKYGGAPSRRGSRKDRRVRERMLVLFRAHGEPAFTEAAGLVSTIESDLERHRFTVGHGLLSALLHDARKTRSRRMGTLSETLTNRRLVPPSDVLQAQMGQFLDDYEWCVRWAMFAGRLASYPPATLPPYKKWREADAEFYRAVKEAIAHDDMETLANTVPDASTRETVRAQLETLTGKPEEETNE
jgi:hypothetical protein